MIIIYNYKLLHLLKKKTLLKVYSFLLEFNSVENTVTYITKKLKYKNKSTVSRALKELRALGFIWGDNTIKQIFATDIV